jgi:alpha-ribazole phosphatase
MEIYVIRHTPVATGKDTCYGQSNVPLANTFLHDTEQFKNQLPTDFDTIYCSPLQRCKDLAEALKLNNVKFDDALMEMNFGDWENKKWNDINQNDLNNWMNDFVSIKTPNGENLLELFDRVKLFMDNLRKQQHKKILLIIHAGVIRCLWAYLLNIPLQNIFKIPVGHNEIFIFNLTDSTITDNIKRTR